MANRLSRVDSVVPKCKCQDEGFLPMTVRLPSKQRSMTSQSLRPRGKTFVGLTSKERSRQLQSLEGFSAYANPHSQEKSPRFCSSCKKRRHRIVELEQEFRDLRERLLSKRTVLDVLDTSAENTSSSSTELALIQESAKLRITIDTLMRFQVRTNSS